MNTKKALAWLAAAFVAFFILTAPNEAGGVVHAAFEGIAAGANAVWTFIRRLVTGS